MFELSSKYIGILYGQNFGLKRIDCEFVGKLRLDASRYASSNLFNHDLVTHGSDHQNMELEHVLRETFVAEKEIANQRMEPLPLVGLTNIGNTCYANSIVQLMIHTPGWKEEMNRKPCGSCGGGSCIRCCVGLIFDQISNAPDGGRVTPKLKTEALEQIMVFGKQQDAHELLMRMRRLLSEYSHAHDSFDFIKHWTRWTCVVLRTCTYCRKVTTVYDDHGELYLYNKHRVLTLVESVADYFNLYYTEKNCVACGQKTTHSEKARIGMFPENLLIFLRGKVLKTTAISKL